jgi:hypothetical protein
MNTAVQEQVQRHHNLVLDIKIAQPSRFRFIGVNMKKLKNLSGTIAALATLLCALALVSASGQSSTVAADEVVSPAATISVFASGLNNPRGLKFGPDGNLYVAEGGTGGLNSTDGACDQVVPPVGPYTANVTGARISKISPRGFRTTVVDNLPSSQTSAASGSLISGVSDVAFIGNKLYALLAGAGCSHGVPSVPNGVIRVFPNTSWSLVANLSRFQMNHPVQNPDPDDFEPDGTWYSMVAVGGDLYALNPNHQELVRISPMTGPISRVVDISISYPGSTNWIGPTAIAYHNGNFFVGTLNPFPIVPGSSKVLKITPTGQISVFASGLTTVLGVAFDSAGRLYVLENTTGVGNQFPTPGTGKVIRIDPSGNRNTLIASGLFLPTAMTFGPDGALYVSNVGFGPPPNGLGQVLRITVP